MLTAPPPQVMRATIPNYETEPSKQNFPTEVRKGSTICQTYQGASALLNLFFFAAFQRTVKAGFFGQGPGQWTCPFCEDRNEC